jgi:hypothetical protein
MLHSFVNKEIAQQVVEQSVRSLRKIKQRVSLCDRIRISLRVAKREDFGTVQFIVGANE